MEVKNDYHECLTNLACSIRRYFGLDYNHNTLTYVDSVLDDYTLTTQDGDEIRVGEKRIYAPNFIYVKNGTPLKLEEGISSKQSTSNQELTEDILKDEEELFTKFFQLTK